MKKILKQIVIRVEAIYHILTKKRFVFMTASIKDDVLSQILRGGGGDINMTYQHTKMPLFFASYLLAKRSLETEIPKLERGGEVKYVDLRKFVENGGHVFHVVGDDENETKDYNMIKEELIDQLF